MQTRAHLRAASRGAFGRRSACLMDCYPHHGAQGHLKMRMAQFLTTIHTTPHVIFLSRHGQSEYNVLGKIGGNPPLSEFGDTYAERLGKWVPDNVWRQDGQLVKVRPLPEWLADCGGWLVES